MPSDATAVLRDVAHHIALAFQFIEGCDFEAFRDDTRTVYAVTRCLEVISEASRRLPDNLKKRRPSIALREPCFGEGVVWMCNTSCAEVRRPDRPLLINNKSAAFAAL